MPDPQGSQPMWRKQRCPKLLFTHDLIVRGRMLRPVVFLSWRPAVCTCEESNGMPSECGHCQGGCEILCPLPCFPNWLEYAGQAPGCVYYILSGLRVLDTFQVEKWHTSCPGRVSVTSGRPSTKTLSGGKGKEWQRQLRTTLLSSSWLCGKTSCEIGAGWMLCIFNLEIKTKGPRGHSTRWRTCDLKTTISPRVGNLVKTLVGSMSLGKPWLVPAGSYLILQDCHHRGRFFFPKCK